MLSRTASSLYWIGRHIERADFVARLIEAALQFELLPQARGSDDWGSAVSSSGAMDRFAASGQDVNRTNVIAFLAFDQDNPGSIMSCMDLARNDARAIRTAITRECAASCPAIPSSPSRMKRSRSTSPRAAEVSA